MAKMADPADPVFDLWRRMNGLTLADVVERVAGERVRRVVEGIVIECKVMSLHRSVTLVSF
jgi:hypothetical protein